MRLISSSDQWPAQYQRDRPAERGDIKRKETKGRKPSQNEMMRSENRSEIKMNGRRGSRLWSEQGGEVWMEVNKACLMRCAVSGQRPGSLIALRERKLTQGGRKKRHRRVLHSNEFK